MHVAANFYYHTWECGAERSSSRLAGERCAEDGVFSSGVWAPKTPRKTLFCASKHPAHLSCLLPKVAVPEEKPSEGGRSLASIPGVVGGSTRPQGAALLCSGRNPNTSIPLPTPVQGGPPSSIPASRLHCKWDFFSPARNPPQAWYLGSWCAREAKVTHITLGRRRKEKTV